MSRPLQSSPSTLPLPWTTDLPGCHGGYPDHWVASGISHNTFLIQIWTSLLGVQVCWLMVASGHGGHGHGLHNPHMCMWVPHLLPVGTPLASPSSTSTNCYLLLCCGLSAFLLTACSPLLKHVQAQVVCLLEQSTQGQTSHANVMPMPCHAVPLRALLSGARSSRTINFELHGACCPLVAWLLALYGLHTTLMLGALAGWLAHRCQTAVETPGIQSS
jgi:hypothetical protein